MARYLCAWSDSPRLDDLIFGATSSAEVSANIAAGGARWITDNQLATALVWVRAELVA